MIQHDGPAAMGVLIVDKPAGMTSQRVVTQLKRHFGWSKAGHTGSLDPLATGLLPVCYGEATKYTQFWLHSDKAYEVCGRWGEQRDTGDVDGQLLDTSEVPAISLAELQAHCQQHMVGDLMQVPPMYSALKHQGKPLHRYARQGKTVDRPARPVRIHEAEIMACDAHSFTGRIVCSKGTYIRTWVEDLAQSLGVYACVEALRRTQLGPIACHQARSLDDLLTHDTRGQPCWLPIESLCDHYDKKVLEVERLQELVFGRALPHQGMDGLYQLWDHQHRFWGMGEVEHGVMRAKRLLSSQALAAYHGCTRGSS